MKFQANKNEGPSKQKWSSKQTKKRFKVKKMKLNVNRNEVKGKQKWRSKQTKMRFQINKNDVKSKQKCGSR